MLRYLSSDEQIAEGAMQMYPHLSNSVKRLLCHMKVIQPPFFWYNCHSVSTRSGFFFCKREPCALCTALSEHNN